MFNTIQEKNSDLTFFGSRDTSVNAAIIISASFKLKYVRVFFDDQYSKLGEYRAS